MITAAPPPKKYPKFPRVKESKKIIPETLPLETPAANLAVFPPPVVQEAVLVRESRIERLLTLEWEPPTIFRVAGVSGLLVAATLALALPGPITIPRVKPPVNVPHPALPVVSVKKVPAAPALRSVTPPPSFVVLREWQGTATRVQEFQTVVVKSRSEWKALWTESGRSGKLPDVDFTRAMVVGIFAGFQPAHSRVEIVRAVPSVLPAAPGLVIYYRERNARPGPAEDGMVVPYRLAVLNRSGLTIRFKAS